MSETSEVDMEQLAETLRRYDYDRARAVTHHECARLSFEAWPIVRAAADALLRRGESRPATEERVMTEVQRATKKFPTWPTDPLHALGVLSEELGELHTAFGALSKAVVQECYEPHKNQAGELQKEAIQTAAMALRFVASLGRYEFKRGEQHEQGAVDAEQARELIYRSSFGSSNLPAHHAIGTAPAAHEGEPSDNAGTGTTGRWVSDNVPAPAPDAAREGISGATELLPCPFCGGKADLLVDDDQPFSWVACTHCDAIGPREMTEEETAESWNRRALLAARPAPQAKGSE